MNIWQTDHEISQTVSRSLRNGTSGALRHVRSYEPADYETPALAYGILRGAASIFRGSRRWFNVDNGYFNPGHYDGYYRISYLGTQPRYMAGIEADTALDIKPFRGGDRIMIVPPSIAVCQFYTIDPVKWLCDAVAKCNKPYFIKQKDGAPIIFDGVAKIITFNSSIGWLGLMEGIEVDSDPLHSVVGSYYATKSIDSSVDFAHIGREPLFRFMRAHQFTLREIEHGDAGWLIKHYLSMSGMIQEKQSVLMLPHIASAAELN